MVEGGWRKLVCPLHDPLNKTLAIHNFDAFTTGFVYQCGLNIPGGDEPFLNIVVSLQMLELAQSVVPGLTVMVFYLNQQLAR